ncbi:Hypothetical_protein [Hexamita inflata]|uniref:Hypothetical_protein n=1 Tax=Hexamita inflata TaxID=28002 RepID=A0AA86P217_9EUKA|nr:Hypothetical protein HINF_LOCUS17811 [Hexamita inflata]
MDIESNKMYQTNLNLSYPKFKIITPKTIRAITLLKIGISLLKMQYINEAEIIFNEAAKLVEIQDVVLHYFTQLYIFFISQLRQQQIDQVKIYKLIKNTLMLTCAGLGNVAIEILNYIYIYVSARLAKLIKITCQKYLKQFRRTFPKSIDAIY